MTPYFDTGTATLAVFQLTVAIAQLGYVWFGRRGGFGYPSLWRIAWVGGVCSLIAAIANFAGYRDTVGAAAAVISLLWVGALVSSVLADHVGRRRRNP